LFVYGTLRPAIDAPMARWLAAAAQWLGPARSRGRLYDLGPHPAMRPARYAREWVSGDLYRLLRRETLLALDRYESGPPATRRAGFVREACVVEHMRGRRLAWAYVYRGPMLRASRIAGGDYCAHRAERAAR
jgi:gamma-glutamylcyclotransferase (GGCT)/AIG2-like uncharacterized protein YtfP